MCSLRQIEDNMYVADIKYDYVMNIINQAAKCSGISRIVLFGSATAENCNDDSDIDIAVFGKNSKISYLKSKEFKDFHRNLFFFKNESGQDYDILYFVEGKEYNDEIMNEINKGLTIYRS